MNFGKSDLPKFVLGDPNSAILGAPPPQDTQQVSGRSGGKKNPAFKGEHCVFIFTASQRVYFGLGVDSLVGGNDLKDTT